MELLSFEKVDGRTDAGILDRGEMVVFCGDMFFSHKMRRTLLLLA